MLQKTIGFAVALPLGGAVTAAADYPSRDITAVVGWAAGGGTDVAARILAAEVQEPPPVRINVTNRTGVVAGFVGLRYASQLNDLDIVTISPDTLGIERP